MDLLVSAILFLYAHIFVLFWDRVLRGINDRGLVPWAFSYLAPLSFTPTYSYRV